MFVTRWWLEGNWCSNTYIYKENWNKIVVLECIKSSDMECSRRLAMKNIWSVESSGTKILATILDFFGLEGFSCSLLICYGRW